MTMGKALPPVLILGCGRSDTSIFGELFQNLSGYQYLSEPDFALMLAEFGHLVAAKVPTESDGFRPDDGLSFPIDTLLKTHPTTKIFWIVRHPFDAVSSLRIGIADNWSHHPRPPDWRSWNDRLLVEKCAHHWAYVNGLGFNRVKENATLIRFEDMLRSPLDFARNVCAQVGISDSDCFMEIQAWGSRVQNTNNENFVEAFTSRHHSRADHKVRIERWRENLTSTETYAIAAMVGDVNQSFGYSLLDDR